MGQIIIIASGKGGSGKSTFSFGAGTALAILGKKVLLADCDIGLRCLDILLGVSDKLVFDWGDVLLDRCDPDQAIIKASKVDVIAAPSEFDEKFTAEAFKSLFSSLSEKYDYILLDAPAGIGKGFRLAASAANRAIVISTPDSVCVRSCSRAANELKSFENIDDVRLVLNMFEAKSACKEKLLNIDDCIDQTGVQLLGIVPRDDKIPYYSVTGELPDDFSPSSLAFGRISKRIDGKKAKLKVK